MAVIFMVLFAACTGGQALLIEPALDRLIGDKDASLLWIIPGGFLCISVVKGFANYFQTVSMQKVRGSSPYLAVASACP